jgi:DeoR family transcriptional regulator, glycerol-3-phosphate regulon repressor
MINLSKRRRNIIDLLARRGYVAIEELSAEFDVTPQTLRRDLQELAEQGLLRRHHGGASANSSTANSDYVMRHIENAEEKARIGTCVAAMIPSGASVFMTPGTTVEAAARAVAAHPVGSLHIVTNSTVAAGILDHCPGVAIQLTGGTWLSNNRALGGNGAVQTVDRFRCDFAVMSIGAIDPAGCLLEYRDEEVVVARAMLRNARHPILLADHTKFSRAATFMLGQLHEFATLVTDQPPRGAVAKLIKDSRCRLVVAS